MVYDQVNLGRAQLAVQRQLIGDVGRVAPVASLPSSWQVTDNGRVVGIICSACDREPSDACDHVSGAAVQKG